MAASALSFVAAGAHNSSQRRVSLPLPSHLASASAADEQVQAPGRGGGLQLHPVLMQAKLDADACSKMFLAQLLLRLDFSTWFSVVEYEVAERQEGGGGGGGEQILRGLHLDDDDDEE
jgi:hypothetical protein